MKSPGRKIVVERCQECDACQEWLLAPEQAPACESLLVMFPSGDVVGARSPGQALRKARAWLRLHMDGRGVSVDHIEWRHGTARE